MFLSLFWELPATELRLLLNGVDRYPGVVINCLSEDLTDLCFFESFS
jgi:hypothetical protein